MSEYKINILPFSLLKDKVNVSFTTKEKEGYGRIYKNNLPINTPPEIKDAIDIFAWWSLSFEPGDVIIPVDLKKNSRFAKYYFNKIIYQHFEKLGLPINRNFINDTEVYVEDHSHVDHLTRKFKQYSLRFDSNSLVKGNSLLVTYDGETYVHKNDISSLRLDREILGRVLFEGRIVKYQKLNEPDKQNYSRIFPILNYRIRKALNIPFDRRFSKINIRNTLST